MAIVCCQVTLLCRFTCSGECNCFWKPERYTEHALVRRHIPHQVNLKAVLDAPAQVALCPTLYVCISQQRLIFRYLFMMYRAVPGAYG